MTSLYQMELLHHQFLVLCIHSIRCLSMRILNSTYLVFLSFLYWGPHLSTVYGIETTVYVLRYLSTEVVRKQLQIWA